MHAETPRGEERPLEVATENARPDVAERNFAQRRDELVLRRRHERRLKSRDAGREHRFRRTAVRGCVGRGEVDAAEAVDVQVDEAGHRDAGAAPLHADASDAPVVHVDVAGDEPAADERRLDAQSHSGRSAGYSRRNRS